LIADAHNHIGGPDKARALKRLHPSSQNFSLDDCSRRHKKVDKSLIIGENMNILGFWRSKRREMQISTTNRPRKLDEIDLRIVNLLPEDARRSRKKVVDELGTALGTASDRIKS
jgi:hypothetical protein